ncbi:MAG: hypothetical protein RLZZ387_2681 [Chloroflexota bacterium]
MGESYSFGDWVHRRRHLLDLTQDELARQVGCSASMLRKIELDERRPSKQLAALLAEQLAVPPEERGSFLRSARAEISADTLPASLAQRTATVEAPLPAPLTPLLGREPDVAALHALLDQPGVRLLTLTGLGGVGKSRLAIRVVDDLRARGASVVFVELAPLTTADQVLPTIARALGITGIGRAPLLERVLAHLRPRHLMLLLDNFEHLPAAAPLVADLLHAAPGLTILVTSRTPLHISGEHEYAVSPLSLPPAPEPGLNNHNLPAIAVAAAVQLFVERVQATHPAFALSQENAATVAAICRRLDGLPLALELAAARAKLLSPEALLGHLDHALSFLVNGPLDLPARQRTLRETVAWSERLLSEAAQTLLARLGVFAGSYTLACADVICADEAEGGRLPHDAVMPAMESLVDSSLVLPVAGAATEPRFRMLETIRAYALERLADAGALQSTRRRHAEHFTAVAEAAEPEGYGPDAAASFAALEDDYDNLRAALEWCCSAQGDTALALRLAAALRLFWLNSRPLAEGQWWLKRVLALPAGEELRPARARLLNAGGCIAFDYGDIERAEVLLRQAVELFRELGDARGCSETLNNLGIARNGRGDYEEAEKLQRESLRYALEAGADDRVAWTLLSLSMASALRGDLAELNQHAEQALALFEQQSSAMGRAVALLALGWSAYIRRDDELAEALLDESDRVARLELGAPSEIMPRLLFGAILSDRGEYERAETALCDCLKHAEAKGGLWDRAATCYELGRLALMRGDAAGARRQLGESVELYHDLGQPWDLAGALIASGMAALMDDDPEAAGRLAREGLALLRGLRGAPPARLAGQASGLAVLAAALALAPGDAAHAACLLGAAEQRYAAHGSARIVLTTLGRSALDPRLLERARKAVQIQLGDTAFAAAWAEGQALSLDEATDHALREMERRPPR